MVPLIYIPKAATYYIDFGFFFFMIMVTVIYNSYTLESAEAVDSDDTAMSRAINVLVICC